MSCRDLRGIARRTAAARANALPYRREDAVLRGFQKNRRSRIHLGKRTGWIKNGVPAGGASRSATLTKARSDSGRRATAARRSTMESSGAAAIPRLTSRPPARTGEFAPGRVMDKREFLKVSGGFVAASVVTRAFGQQ